MAETDISHEFGREPGFSRMFFSGFCLDSSHMLHLQSQVELAVCHHVELQSLHV